MTTNTKNCNICVSWYQSVIGVLVQKIWYDLFSKCTEVPSASMPPIIKHIVVRALIYFGVGVSILIVLVSMFWV